MELLTYIFLLVLIGVAVGLAFIMLFAWLNYKIRSNEPEWLQKYHKKYEDEEGNIYWEQTDKPKTK